jgi:ABC-type multidrug transport system ATPase subunit
MQSLNQSHHHLSMRFVDLCAYDWLQGTNVISLLQPAPEVYDLFDDVMVMSGRRIVFNGPRHAVLPFFESMGFKCPASKTTADFLQEVVTCTDQEVGATHYTRAGHLTRTHTCI